MMLSYAAQPAWLETCEHAMEHALELRAQFFDNIVLGLKRRRLEGLLGRIDARKSLAPAAPTEADLRYRAGDDAPPLYANRIDKAGIEFTVTRVPLKAEVLDPRMVAIAPGKRNERHRHAHETLIYFLEGTGRVYVDEASVDVRPGDAVMVPRWSIHQTQNTGPGTMRFLAVTDYNLTDRALVGDAKAYRENESANLHRHERS
jgi:quercetin dioxygenase-like cupin family protein